MLTISDSYIFRLVSNFTYCFFKIKSCQVLSKCNPDQTRTSVGKNVSSMRAHHNNQCMRFSTQPKNM